MRTWPASARERISGPGPSGLPRRACSTSARSASLSSTASPETDDAPGPSCSRDTLRLQLGDQLFHVDRLAADLPTAERREASERSPSGARQRGRQARELLQEPVRGVGAAAHTLPAGRAAPPGTRRPARGRAPSAARPGELAASARRCGRSRARGRAPGAPTACVRSAPGARAPRNPAARRRACSTASRAPAGRVGVRTGADSTAVNGGLGASRGRRPGPGCPRRAAAGAR